MEKNTYSEIKTKRLVLRRPKPSDWKIISFLRSDKTVNQFVIRPAAETKEKALAFIAKVSTGIKKGELLYWVITEKNNDIMLGAISLWNFSEDKKTAEVGYDLSPKDQGKGMMSEALKNVIEFGFDVLFLDKIEAYTQKNNERSIILLERNDFTLVKGKTDTDNPLNIVYEIKAKRK